MSTQTPGLRTEQDRPRGPKYSELKAGMKLRCDDCFTCIAAGAVVEVYGNIDVGFCIPCNDGDHLLDGQCDFDDNDTLIGVELVTEVNA